MNPCDIPFLYKGTDFHGKCLVSHSRWFWLLFLNIHAFFCSWICGHPPKGYIFLPLSKRCGPMNKFWTKGWDSEEIWAISHLCLWKEQMCLFLSIFPYFLAMIKMWWYNVLGQHRKKIWILAAWMELHIRTWFLMTLWSRLPYQCRLNVKEIQTT